MHLFVPSNLPSTTRDGLKCIADEKRMPFPSPNRSILRPHDRDDAAMCGNRKWPNCNQDPLSAFLWAVLAANLNLQES